MHRQNRLMAVIAISAIIVACSAETERVDKVGDPAPAVDAASLAGACDDYLATFNTVSEKSSEHFYKLFRAAGREEASIESETDRWIFVGGTIEKAMLADEWASLTLWHRSLQDHLRSIAVLSSENHYNFPEDAEAAVQMSEKLESAYVRCKFARDFVS
jgi:hypothetical protein